MNGGPDQIINSSRWAAYGDALGFVTELADPSLIKRRIGAAEVDRLQPWNRKTGGRFGVNMQLPAGAYSDDTQLRLAVSRSIRGDGSFNVETFAKVELPVWLNYALGAGRGSKAAATALTRADATWANNDFDVRGLQYTNIGGNGAAMRVQPHVWSAPSPDQPSTFLLDVIRDSICTHGHPRGIMGAAFHAVVLARAMVDRRAPAAPYWHETLEFLRVVPELIDADEQLSLLWLPAWQRSTGLSFASSWEEVVAECHAQVDAVSNRHPREYRDAVKQVGGLEPSTRGSGTATAILASFAAHALANDPAAGLRLIANTLGSDTDSIATMAGAIIGATTSQAPPEPVQDQGVLDSEAERLWQVSVKRPAPTFVYPDLLKWAPPKAQIDVVGIDDRGDLAIAGLGAIQQVSDASTTSGSSPQTVMWAQLTTGQTILVKMRVEPGRIESSQLPTGGPWRAASVAPERKNSQQQPIQERTSVQETLPSEQQALFSSTSNPDTSEPPKDVASVEELVASVTASGFAPHQVGQAILSQIRGGRYDIERAAALAGMIAAAKNRVRPEHDRR